MPWRFRGIGPLTFGVGYPRCAPGKTGRRFSKQLSHMCQGRLATKRHRAGAPLLAESSHSQKDVSSEGAPQP